MHEQLMSANMELRATNSVLAESAAGRGLPFWERALDLALLLALLPGILLVGAVVALIIKVGSPGPIFFRQNRVGYKGRHFICYKFRTMGVNAETESHKRHVQELIKSQARMVKLDARKDPRLIPLGSILRACGLDELPQLLNVLLGDMSLVGPRPCIPYETEHFQPHHFERFSVPAGITGLWQVKARARSPFVEALEMDVLYARSWSFGRDIMLLLQ